MSAFVKGREKSGGRRSGARNKISNALLTAIAEDFEIHGAEVVRIARVEKPIEYLRITASLIPASIEIDNSRLTEVTDAELCEAVEELLKRRNAAVEVARGAESTHH